MHTRQKDDQRRRGTDEERDEDTRHGYEALHRGILHLGHSVSVGRSTHTGFVGKEATSDPVAMAYFIAIPAAPPAAAS